MERDVERVKRSVILGRDRRDLLSQIGGERILVSARHAASGFGRDLSFESAADEQALARVVERNPRDERAVLGRDVDQAIIGKAANGGGNRKARNPQPFAQSCLVDQTPGLKDARENRLLQFAVYGVRLRMGAFCQILPAA